MEISVIIPTYCPKEYIKKCLESLIFQTFSKDLYEIIIILNGSDVSYYNMIQSFIRAYKGTELPYIKLLDIDQSGVSNARNVGLDRARGQYICFVDDDDYVSHNYLEELYKSASPSVVSCSNTYSFYDGDDVLLENDITMEYSKNCKLGYRSVYQVKKFFSGPVYKLIHKSIIGKNRFNIKFKNGEDSLFMFQISKNINNVSMSSDNCIYYRRLRVNSATSTKKTLKYRFLLLCRAVLEYFIIYFQAPFKFNLIFFSSRILGALKTFFLPN